MLIRPTIDSAARLALILLSRLFEWPEQSPALREPHQGIVMVTGYDESLEIYNAADRFSSFSAVKSVNACDTQRPVSQRPAIPPPSTTKSAPVTQRASSDAKYNAQ